MSVCYILYSEKLQKFYTGITQDDIAERIKIHNNSAYGVHFTSQTNDWELFMQINCVSVAQSMKIEKHIKSMKSSQYIRNLKRYPEMIEKLLKKYG